jgi:hypothetical protein
VCGSPDYGLFHSMNERSYLILDLVRSNESEGNLFAVKEAFKPVQLLE